MRALFAVLADYANISRDGKLNVMGIFDRVFARKLPSRLPPMQLVIRLEAQPEELDREHGIGIQLADPEGRAVFDINGNFTPRGAMPGEAVTINHVVRLADVPLERTGLHRIRIRVDDQTVGEVPLRVDQPPQQPAPGPGSEGDAPTFH